MTCHGKPATITGTTGDDVLVGTPGPDVIVGGSGIDQIAGAGGDDLICEGPTPFALDDEDYPRYSFINGDAGNDVLDGGSGLDSFNGGSGRDLILGGPGPDLMLGGGGADVLRGGGGSDRLGGGDDGGGDLVDGGRGADTLADLSGPNTVRGGPGDDELDSGDADDHIVGGPGQDVVSYIWTSTGSHCHKVKVNLSSHTGRANGFGHDTLQGIEDVWSSGGDDLLVGDSRNNTFYTGFVACGKPTSTDRVFGRGGSDTLTLDSETVEGASGTRGARIDLAHGRGRWEFNGTNRYRFTSVENVVGSDGPDRIVGTDGPNVLTGAGGSVDDGDVIAARGGDDLLVGRQGADLLYGGAGDDRLSGSSGADTLDGGKGTNHNDGGLGSDQCRRPGPAQGAVACEHP
ncbi:calcium-binding protein [Nocardioides sp. HB32]